MNYFPLEYFDIFTQLNTDNTPPIAIVIVMANMIIIHQSLMKSVVMRSFFGENTQYFRVT